jgi:hypothetical protein
LRPGPAKDQVRAIKVTLQASTDAKIFVWQNGDLVYASRADKRETQVCLAVDLFEVIADLAGLDLDRQKQADEAVALANEALGRLAQTPN